MSAVDTLKSLFKFEPAPVAIRAAPTTEMFGPLGQRAADWSSVNNSAKVRDVFRTCATAYACSTLLADAVAESPLRVYKTVNGEMEEQPNHRARVLVANPNPVMSEAEFMSLNVMVMCLFGYTVVEVVRSAARLPVQLWPLRPDWLHAERVSTGEMRYVLRVPGLDPRLIDREDLIVIPYRHDERQEAPGVSPLHIVAREVGIDVALTDLLKVFLDAGGIPPWAVEVPDANPKQEELDLFREKWQQRYGGWQAYSQIGILYGGMKLHKLGDSIGDMAWPDLRGLTELKIAQAFRVPADLIQARDTLKSGSLTTTEMDGAMAFLQLHGAKPLRQRIDGAFTRILMVGFGADSSLSLEFDTSGIGALQENADALHTRVRANWQASLVTQNEARRALGLPDMRGGDVFAVPPSTMFVPAGQLVGVEAERASRAIVARSGVHDERQGIYPLSLVHDGLAGDLDSVHGCMGGEFGAGLKRTYRDLKALTPGDLETRASALTTINRDRQRLTEIGARQLRKFFTAQGVRIRADLRKTAPTDLDVKADAINWDDEEKRLWDEVMEKLYHEIGKRAFDNVNGVAGTAISWDLANPNVSRIMDELGLRIVDISKTTRQDVVRVVTQGQADGLNLSQIADSITDLFEQSYTGRAMTVARTETQVSYNLASQLGYQESGVVEQVELSDNSSHDEDYGASDGLTCAERDGMIVNIGQIDHHVYAEHPNGSLAILPILSGPALGEV